MLGRQGLDSRPSDLDRRFGSLGLRFLLGRTVVPMGLATSMGPPQYRSQRISSNCVDLCSMGNQLSGKQVFFECDNSSVVMAANQHYTREPEAMHLLRCLCFFVAHFDIDIKCRHIATILQITFHVIICVPFPFAFINPHLYHDHWSRCWRQEDQTGHHPNSGGCSALI